MKWVVVNNEVGIQQWILGRRRRRLRKVLVNLWHNNKVGHLSQDKLGVKFLRLLNVSWETYFKVGLNLER